jgi:hypothetical protein
MTDWQSNLCCLFFDCSDGPGPCCITCCGLGRETAALRCKVDELRVEIDAHLNIQDKLRQESMKLRSENDELRGYIRPLQR